MNYAESYQEPSSLFKKDFELDDNLNIDNEVNNKTSSKVLHRLFTHQINNDSNILINKNNKLKNNNIFTDKDSFTIKEIRKTTRDYFHLRKRPSIKNFEEIKETPLNLNNLNNLGNLNNKVKKELYFEDDMFIPESSSFPNEHEEDFLNQLKFIEENDYDEDIIDSEIKSNSISYKTNQKDNILLKNFNNNNIQGNHDNNPPKKIKLDDLFFNEKEKIGKNILYLDLDIQSIPTDKNNNENNGKSDNNEGMFNFINFDLKEIDNIINNNDSKDNNENNISYISLDLLIKKIALENFRINFSYIYDCFLQQFKYFLPIKNFISKIISAFNYYNKTIKKNSSELIYFLNDIIFQNYEIIKNNKNNLEQIQIFYLKIKNIKFDNPKVNQDLITIYYLLFNNINKNNDNNNNMVINDKINNNDYNDIDDYIEKNYNSRKKRGKSILYKLSTFKEKIKKKETKEIKRNEKKHNYKYFYIFDYTKEEIAAYLSLESYKLLSDIQENELFNKNFNSKEKEKKAPNVMKIIDRYDKLIFFIIEDICSYDHKSERVEVIEKWLRIANVCLDFKNFNDLVMINSLFCNYLFKKLKKTWKKLSKKTLMSIKKLNNFCTGNQCYINIRKEIFKSKGKAYVPFLGILLKEIMTLEEMKYILKNNNINIKKLIKLNKVINHFFEFKNNNYNFEKPKQLEILSNVSPKKEEEIELIIKGLEPELTLHAKSGDKKRKTQSDELYYK